MHRDTKAAAHAAQRDIAAVCPEIGGFFMCPERGCAVLLMEQFHNLAGLANTHNKRLAELLQALVKLAQAIMDKVPMPTRGKGLTPVVRLDNIERNDRRALLGRFKERCMVLQAQITLEPDNMRRGARHGAYLYCARRAEKLCTRLRHAT